MRSAAPIAPTRAFAPTPGVFAAFARRFDLPQRRDGSDAHADYLKWSTPAPRDLKLDLSRALRRCGRCCRADTIICNGAGNYSGWWHRYWRYAGPGCQLAPTAGAMGYGVPAATAAALRHPERMVVALAGDGCFLMNGQELATAVAHGADMLVLVIDNGGYGTIRMHQERDYPGRISGRRSATLISAALGRTLWLLGGNGGDDRGICSLPLPAP